MVSLSVRSDILRNSNVLASLKSAFDDRQEILLAFLFGSVAGKRSRPSSDVDIGILFEVVPEIHAMNDMREELSSILQREVDLAVLNHASPVLNMQILKNGILLYARDRKHYHHFFVDTVNQYDDLKRIRKTCEENILKGRIYAAG